MCRSIKTLRPPYTEDAGPQEMQAAALQYVRKIAGMRAPSRANQEAFDEAVRQVTAATDQLLASITVGPSVQRSSDAATRRSPRAATRERSSAVRRTAG
ncbi:MAG TPA: DUF2277 domain-containing protein [Nakamurella sp.]